MNIKGLKIGKLFYMKKNHQIDDLTLTQACLTAFFPNFLSSIYFLSNIVGIPFKKYHLNENFNSFISFHMA